MEHISHVGSALALRSLVLLLAARSLVGCDHDQGLSLPEFSFLLCGSEELVLVKVYVL